MHRGIKNAKVIVSFSWFIEKLVIQETLLGGFLTALDSNDGFWWRQLALLYHSNDTQYPHVVV
jgi:hypothetical protein